MGRREIKTPSPLFALISLTPSLVTTLIIFIFFSQCKAVFGVSKMGAQIGRKNAQENREKSVVVGIRVCLHSMHGPMYVCVVLVGRYRQQ